MAMGVVSDEEFESEFQNTVQTQDSSRNNSESDANEPSAPAIRSDILEGILDGTVETGQIRGRNEGDNNVPNSLRKIIGETSNLEGRKEALELARMFGISASSVSAYAAGATSTKSYDEKKPDIISFITSRKNRITKKALRKITFAIDQITEDKLESLGARDLASVGKDLSTVVKSMEPEVQVGQNPNGPRFLVYAPQLMQENHFETIQLNE